MESTLAQQNYTILFNPEHLPSAMQAEGRNLFSKRERLEAQLAANAEETLRWIQRAKQWLITASNYGPEDLLHDETWENYYAAVILSDDPLFGDTALLTAKERDPIEQRILATGLLMGTIKTSRREQLEERARSLICSTDPRNQEFFTDATLNCCLQEEKLTDKKSINKVLARETKTYVTQEDKRQALWTLWQERNNAKIEQYRFDTEDWGDLETIILDTFTTFVWWEITRNVHEREWNPHSASEKEMRLAIMSILREHEDRGLDPDNYHLDPRDSRNWQNIETFVGALRNQNHSEWWDRWQNQETPAQRWMKDYGMTYLYGSSADWWTDTEDQTSEDLDKLDPSSCLLDPYDPNTYFKETFRTSKVKEFIWSKYSERMQRILKNA